MEAAMRKGVLVGMGAVLALTAIGAEDASACSRRSGGCGAYYAPPVDYRYAPQAYGYGYGFGPPPVAVYGWPEARYGYAPGYGYSSYGYSSYGYRRGPHYYGESYYGPAAGGWGDRSYRHCDHDGYGYAPPASYDPYDGYRRAGWWTVR
jgi:hypothetical protein